MILFIKNITIEGPETLGAFFQEKGFGIKVVDLSQGESLPQEPSSIEAVVCLGGPMNVYEEGKYPFLKEEDVFIKKILSRGIPFLGICLGSQLLAKACGVKVTKSPRKETGFFTIGLTEEGQEDPLFHALDSFLEVFQWHGDMFEIPQGAQLLAMSEDCPHQAFRVGKSAYGLQFHIEITDESIRAWADAYFKKDDKALKDQTIRMLADYSIKKEIFNKVADQVYNNFLQIMKDNKR